METNQAECPVCLGCMQPEDRNGIVWLVCPNGCPTEFEDTQRKPATAEVEMPAAVMSARAGGSAVR